MKYGVGDRVQVYIPRADDPEHRYHGRTGEVVDVFEDDLSDILDNPCRGYLYTVDFEDPELEPTDFRYDDLQHPDQ